MGSAVWLPGTGQNVGASVRQNRLSKDHEAATRTWPTATGQGGHFPSRSWLPSPSRPLLEPERVAEPAPRRRASLPLPKARALNNRVGQSWGGLFVCSGQQIRAGGRDGHQGLGEARATHPKRQEGPRSPHWRLEVALGDLVLSQGLLRPEGKRG